MAMQLLSETLGEDSTTQLLRDADGAYHVRVMTLKEGGQAGATPADAATVLHEQPIAATEARTLFKSAAATRLVAEGEAFTV